MVYHLLPHSDTPLLKISAIGGGLDSSNRFGPGVRTHYCVHYVTKGKGIFNGTPVKAGQGFLITPNTYQYYYPDPEDPWEYVWIDSYDDTMGELFKFYQAPEETGVFTYNNIPAIEDVLQILKESKSEFTAPSLLTELFLRMLNSHLSRPQPPANNGDLYFEYAVRYMSANLHIPLRIQDILEHIGISQPYLYRIFQERTGLSPKQYLDQCKIGQAKRLLRTTHLTIAEIGNSIGFTDQLAFSKFFSGKVHCSPRAYREQKLK